MSLGIEALKKCELFEPCDDALLEKILAQSKERTYAAGEQVYEEMSESDELLLVVAGQLKQTSALLDAAGIDWERISGPGEVLNLVKFVAEGPNYVRCEAESETRVLVWNAKQAAEFWNDYPEVGFRITTNIARLLYDRVQQLNQVILDRVSWGLD